MLRNKARDYWKRYTDELNSAMSRTRTPFHSNQSQHLKMLRGDISMQ